MRTKIQKTQQRIETVVKSKIGHGLFIFIILLLVQPAFINALSMTRNSVEQNDSLKIDTLNLKVLVPAYFDPSTANYWERLEKQAAKMPGRLCAIANLDNGPGSQYASSYSSAITAMNDSGGKVIGYVWTNYGAVALNSVEADIDKWYSFYPNINGIFLDGGADATGEENYYATIYSYIKQKSSSSLVITNPGINTLESYLVYNGNRVSDAICIFESNTGFDTWTPSPWCSKYSRDNFCVLPYSTSSTDYINRVNRAASLGIGWIYCTNDVLPNPWDTLPPYFEAFCDYVLNGDTVAQTTGSSASINIDGHFSDWQGIAPLTPAPNYACPDSDADIINIWAANDTSNLYLSYQVAGIIDASNYFYHIFIDVDYNPLDVKTGFVYNDSALIGAGYMVENNLFWKYNGSGGSNWTWVAASGMEKADSAGRSELSIPLNGLFLSDSSKTIALILDVNEAASPYSVLDLAPTSYKTQCYVYQINSVTAVRQQTLNLPSSYSLSQNYPNPFNPTTDIQYQLPKAGLVNIQIYNVIGQEVSTIVNEVESAGPHVIRFDGRNLSSGMYFYSFRAGDFSSVKKMILLK